MQLIATGKWSKSLKHWTMIVAMRRPFKAPHPAPNRPFKLRPERAR
jgi:hypothetical protein